MSAISWTDATVNPVIGCSKVSAECTACYAESQGTSLSRRFVNGAGARYLNVIDGKRWNGRTYVDHDYMARTKVTKRRTEPDPVNGGKRWRPARIFLGSMTDMLHETLTVDDMAAVGAWMGRCSWARGPIWQIVTKRPERAPLLLPALINAARLTIGTTPRIHLLTTVGVRSSLPRLDALLACHGMPGVEVLGVSAEPLLEAVNFRPWLATGRLGWIIPGGESGPKARPCHEDWIRDVVQACAEYGVPCWTKQLGAHALYSDRDYRRPLSDPSGSDPAEWPMDLRVQVWP
jgi:protein gp37